MRNWKREAVAMAGVLAMTLIAVGGDGEAARGRANEIRFTECLVIKKVGRFGRVPVHTDAIEARIVAGI